MNTAPDPVEPPITDELRQAALQRKGGWLYSVDPAYDPDGPVPGHAVVGAWPVDEHGAIGPFTHNPNYRPTAQALGLPAPDNPVTAALQAAATGHGSEHDLIAAARAHTWIVPAHPDGTPRLTTRPDGSPVLDI
ncbi:type VII secretion system-associated protein [Kitasatospora sp. NPDC085895]|uniref:type VII secretion system-associated protein n=1 Tax=Kitasatospora sp. NPDC085895 TaxID=3155057 RepID=UPI00344FE7A8